MKKPNFLRMLSGAAILVVISLIAAACSGGINSKVSEKDINLINSSDSDIGPVFISNSSQEAVVTWNPIVQEILSQVPNVRNAYNSSQIPGQILDIMFLRTDVVTEHPEVAYALAGAWYETMKLMTGKGPETEKALKAMAERSGTTVESYKQQLATTYMYWKAANAAEFARDSKLIETMDLVRRFSYDHGLFGQGATSVDDIGIQFPDGTVLGDPKNVKLRFVDTYMKFAAQGTPSKSPHAGNKLKVTIMWSIYVGWMPWPYAEESGILKKWADKYNLDIELKQADYIATIEAFVAGQADGVVMTNMEALTMPAAAGINTTAIIIGDYSNGNDALLTRNGLGICDLAGKDVYLVELSVSQYLLARGLENECGGKVTNSK